VVDGVDWLGKKSFMFLNKEDLNMENSVRVHLATGFM